MLETLHFLFSLVNQHLAEKQYMLFSFVNSLTVIRIMNTGVLYKKVKLIDLKEDVIEGGHVDGEPLKLSLVPRRCQHTKH